MQFIPQFLSACPLSAGTRPARLSPFRPRNVVGSSQVACQTLFPPETGGAEMALEGLLARVNPLVDDERLLRLDHLLAVSALELGLLVDPLVRPHHRGGRLADAAVPALVPLVRGVDFQLVPAQQARSVFLPNNLSQGILLHFGVRQCLRNLENMILIPSSLGPTLH